MRFLFGLVFFLLVAMTLAVLFPQQAAEAKAWLEGRRGRVIWMVMGFTGGDDA